MAAGALDSCRALVEAGDPDRALVTRGAGADRLWPVWAFNLEVARAPWASREPMVAEIRLQFWADAVAALDAARGAPAHPVIGPLAGVLPAGGAAVLAALVEARRRDVWREPFADRAALERYLEATAAGLMWVAAGVLGAGPAAEPAVRAYGWAAGLAAWLQAVPQLQARGWEVMPEAAEAAALARVGLARIAAARAGRGTVPAAAFPALATGWQAEGILKRALADPGRVAAGALAGPEVARRGGLLWKGLTGRW